MEQNKIAETEVKKTTEDYIETEAINTDEGRIETTAEKTASEKAKEYQAAWNKANTRMIHCKMNCKTDADILAYLEQQDNVAGLIKSLIRAKMA